MVNDRSDVAALLFERVGSDSVCLPPRSSASFVEYPRPRTTTRIGDNASSTLFITARIVDHDVTPHPERDFVPKGLREFHGSHETGGAKPHQ
jgi:hypothetical protein